eukprot:scaffold26215_cov107-Isochrysis_galbana.AAC.10
MQHPMLARRSGFQASREGTPPHSLPPCRLETPGIGWMPASHQQHLRFVTHTSISTSSPAVIPFGLHGVKSEQIVGAALREAVQTHGVLKEQPCELTPSRLANSSTAYCAGTRRRLAPGARGRLHARDAAEPADGMDMRSNGPAKLPVLVWSNTGC